MSSEPLGRRVLRGMRLNLLGQGATVAVTLLVTPRLVAAWGEEGYGLYTLIWPLISYVTLLNLGAVGAVQRFSAHLSAPGQAGRLSALLRRAGLFLAAATGLGALGLLLGRAWLVERLFDVPAGLAAEAAALFAWTAAGAVPHTLLVFGSSVLYGRQRFGAHAALMTLQTGGLGVLAALLVAAGRGLWEVGAAFLLLETVLAAAALWLARGPLGVPPRPAPGDLRDFADFSWRGAIGQALWVLTFHGDRLFIGRVLPVAQLGFYGAAAGIAQKLGVLTAAVSSIAYPILTELHGAGEEERLRRFYLKATELALYLSLPATILAFALAPQFLTLWLGEPFSRFGAWPLRLLILGNLAYGAHLLPNNVASGKGHPHWAGVAQAAKGVVLLALWAALIPRWGLVGAAGGLAGAEAAASAAFLAHVHRRLLRLGIGEYLASCARPAAAGAALALFALTLRARIGSWPELIGASALGLAIYLAAGWLLLDRESRGLLRDIAQRSAAR